MLELSPKQKVVIFVIPSVLVIIFILLVLKQCITSKTSNYYLNLEVWGLFDDSSFMNKAASEYQKRNPRVRQINYRKLTIEEYETALLDALATGRGPDVFLVHNSWLPKHKNKLAPASIKNSDGTELVIVTPKMVKENFVDVVSQDFVSDNQVYALPLSVDSLALYYNKDILNSAGITQPPKTWNDFISVVERTTRFGESGNIEISGAAMGFSSDGSPGEGKINRATDILALLMLQNGTQMNDPNTGQVTFAEYFGSENAPDEDSRKPPGQQALEFYTSFSNPASKTYCWNSNMHNSIDSFIEGRTAMMINYSWLISRIQNRSPKLNFAVSNVPQIKETSPNTIDFPNYWAFAVSQSKIMDYPPQGRTPYATNEQRIFEAWRFIRYLALNPEFSQDLPVAPENEEAAKFDPAVDYINEFYKPAARRDIIQKQREDVWLSPFVNGNLIARNWQMPDNLSIEKIFDEMIDDVVLRNVSPYDAIRRAQNAVNVLIGR